MKEYKLIAIDVDDTLVNSQLKITPRVKQAVKAVKEMGIMVTLATGRMYPSALPFAKELGIELPLITYQGALIKNPLNDDISYHRPVPVELAREIVQCSRMWNVHLNVYLHDQLYMEKLSQEGLDYGELAGVAPYLVPDLMDVLNEEPTKMLIIANEETLDQIAREVGPRFGHQLYITKSKPFYLEFMHHEASKGQALKFLAHGLGFERGQILAMGDSYNDLDMIQYAGMGVVMGNARDEIKAIGDYITSTNDCDGVAEALEKLIIQQVDSFRQ